MTFFLRHLDVSGLTAENCDSFFECPQLTNIAGLAVLGATNATVWQTLARGHRLSNLKYLSFEESGISDEHKLKILQGLTGLQACLFPEFGLQSME